MKNTQQEVAPHIQPFAHFCRSCGISDVTGWRYRKAGWITTINIAGRPYVTCEEITRFKTRAASGEFARQRIAPRLCSPASLAE